MIVRRRTALLPGLGALLLAGALALSAAAPTPGGAAPGGTPALRTVVFVRHAEKDSTVLGNDPPLSAAGRARAEALAGLFEHTRFDAIFVTPFARTRETAGPIARANGLAPTEIRDTDSTLAAIGRVPWGGTALVVGHSNTVPQLITRLTGRPFPDSAQVTYDRVWVVSVSRDGDTGVLRLRYGAPAAMAR